MDHYQEIIILPDPEFSAAVLMSALFAKLHRVLVQHQCREIGISFVKMDEAKSTLGNVLRLHGGEEVLHKLQAQNWLTGMRDHTDVKEVTPVPTHAQHRRVKRVQTKSSAERLRRRYLKRHPGVTESEVKDLIPDSVEKGLALPYLQLKSDSTGQCFRLFIEQQTLLTDATTGEFNAYGLSTTATIPWF